MKALKISFLILVISMFIFSFISCSDEHTHKDENNDTKCDECGETLANTPEEPEKPEEPEDPKVEGAIELIKDGVANFKIVYASRSGSDIRKAVENFTKNMKSDGIDIVFEPDNKSEPTDIEVLIGSITNRGEEYAYDMYSLGKEGYMVKVVGTKIIVLGGSPDALKDAVEAFIEDFVGYKKGRPVKDLTVSEDDSIIEIQDNYRITGIKVDDTDLKGYSIAVGSDIKIYKDAATTLQTMLYEKAGYWLPIVELTDDIEKSIVIASVDDAGSDGFRVEVRDSNLFIECAYDNALEKAFNDFIAQNISVAQGDIIFDSDFKYTAKISVVSYKDFGAKADGMTNDFFAIKAAHDYANEGGQTVVAGRGTYYISKTNGNHITIKTDVDWRNAEFIIDDREIAPGDPEQKVSIFRIFSNNSVTTLTPTSTDPAGEAINALNASAKDNDNLVFKRDDVPKIDLGLGYPAMLTIYNSTQKQYIRYGGNANEGSDQHETIIIDAEGNVDPSTPILHDFPVITKIEVRRIDDPTLTINGGVFTTRANQCEKASYAYYSRNINIERPNTVIKNFEHYITDEGEQGNPYSGFLSVQNTYNTLIQDTVLTGHRVYSAMSSQDVTPQGTYDLSFGNSCGITLKNVIQSNFFHLDEYGNPTTVISTVTHPTKNFSCWGIMGSNYCKNITYDGCKLTRFDAHCGTYNGTIINSDVCMLAIIGGGTLRIENSNVYSTGNNFLSFRDDYGSTFSGDVIIKDVTFKTTSSNTETITLMNGKHTNHYFGYQTFLPYTVTIDNFKVESPVKTKTVVIFNPGFVSAGIHLPQISGSENLNPMVPTEKVIIKNNNAGYEYKIPAVDVFENLVIEYKDDEE